MRPLPVGMILLMLMAACAPARATPAALPRAPASGGEVAVPPVGMGPAAQPPQPLKEEAAARDRLAATPMPPGVNPPGLVPNPAARMIIKNAEMRLIVSHVDEALTRIEGLVADLGGYILNSRTWFQEGEKYAALTFAVPSERFEEALGRLRRIALRVADENTSGQDVSPEYVDLEARLANLEAAAARLREFLQQAKSVEEALEVEARLRELEGEIAQVKGRMNFLKGRSAYSLITVTLEPMRPTPTPTPTPTPVVWNPGQTFQEATEVLGVIMRALVDLSIWVLVLGGPFILPAGLLTFVVYRLRNRHPPKAG
ncbi:DUF4349 domain-containing protein [Thermoflexus hugenholtzii]|jgi:hypothetical protein|uniref:DUF4349 domain-containing protein n=1 Tax=Thermoflexus hugenholtzii JAD2 TaxID=877466 RepID=A0A212R5N3_9CHLR|nr:DUF4349 domain-containing protein [Thermoflexus hugenholtzii]SNB67378.1 protein of unknown function [Thermoflexus hugenholtzii JAD2]